MVETLRYTDSEGIDEAFAELSERIDQANALEGCLATKGCPLLDIIRELSANARNRLVETDPNNRIKIIQLQQTAKVFDAMVMTIQNRFQAAETAAMELKSIEEGDDGA